MNNNFLSKYDLLQKLRLYSGIILVVYACTHLLNHSIGIINLESMENGRLIFVAFWRHPLLSWVVPTSLIVHVLLTLQKLYWKNTFKGQSALDWIQIVLGLIIPLVLVPHVVETRVARLYVDIDDNYSFYLGTYHPAYLVEWFFGILMMWGHGVIGLKMYLNQQPWFLKWKSLFQIIYIGVPICGFLGIVSAGKEIQRLKEDPGWFAGVLQQSNPADFPYATSSEEFAIWFAAAYLLVLLLLFTFRYARIRISERKNNVQIKYLNGKKVSINKGTSLLEASLKARIPHAHVCGGRGRCSTCRVQVIDGIENLTPPGEEELELLKKVNVGKNVRLACKSKPLGACTIYPIFASSISMNEVHRIHPEKQGVDKEIAILFSDLRGFTALTEHKLPYDVVHVLNLYYQFMGQAIESNGGKVDKFIGDGIMALFGMDTGLKTGCAQALAAAKAMSRQMELLNENLQSDLNQPLQLGIGIHCGSVVVGEMGFRDVVSMTAIGDVVNTASRLENECKIKGCELVVSADVAQNAGVELSDFPSHELQVRGRSQQLQVYCLNNASEIDLSEYSLNP